MTTPSRAGAVSLSDATAALLTDGWHPLTARTLGAVIDPAFADPATGQLVTPGDTWFQFTDTGGQVYAAPMHGILGVKLAAAVP